MDSLVIKGKVMGKTKGDTKHVLVCGHAPDPVEGDRSLERGLNNLLNSLWEKKKIKKNRTFEK